MVGLEIRLCQKKKGCAFSTPPICRWRSRSVTNGRGFDPKTATAPGNIKFQIDVFIGTIFERFRPNLLVATTETTVCRPDLAPLQAIDRKTVDLSFRKHVGPDLVARIVFMTVFAGHIQKTTTLIEERLALFKERRCGTVNCDGNRQSS